MRTFARYVAFLLILAGMSGCGEKGAKLQKSVVPPDKSLFETGSDYLKKSQYIKARLAFQTLINTYPDSDLAADSYLAIADSFYDEAGLDNLLQAEDQYKNFIIFFPTSPKTVDAQMKIISLNMKMMRSPDRDKTYSYKAEAAIQKFLTDYPDSEYAAVARQYLREVQENLAQGDYGVGMFYSTKGNHIAAKSRFKEITDNYKEFSLMDEALFHLARVAREDREPRRGGDLLREDRVGVPVQLPVRPGKRETAGHGEGDTGGEHAVGRREPGAGQAPRGLFSSQALRRFCFRPRIEGHARPLRKRQEDG